MACCREGEAQGPYKNSIQRIIGALMQQQKNGPAEWEAVFLLKEK